VEISENDDLNELAQDFAKAHGLLNSTKVKKILRKAVERYAQDTANLL